MTSAVIFWRDGSLGRQRHARTPAERVASGGFGAPPVVVFDWDESKHPRDEKGRFGEGDGGGKRKEGEGTGTKDDPIYTKHPKLAVKLLGEGKYVELDQPRKVSTMLDRISKIVADAQKHGEQAPTYNLCHASVAGTNLFCEESKGIPRVMMPQLKGTPEPDSWADKNLPKDKNGEVNLGPAFIDELRSRGIATESTTVPANVLRATQNELDGARVAEVADKLESGKKWAGSIYATSDDYIVDGHHHWAADIGVGYHEGHIMDVNVQRIDAPILQVLAIANNFTESRGLPHKRVGDNLTAAGDFDESKHPRDERGRFGEKGDQETEPHLTVKNYEGRVGDRSHLTRSEEGTIPTSMIADLPGVMGETPGTHGARGRQGADWDAFLNDVRENGIQQPIFITVDHGEEPKISEGNSRRDAAVELGLKSVPVEIRYFGHAEQEGTVAERARRSAVVAAGDFDESKHPRGGDPANPGRFSPAGEGGSGEEMPAGWTEIGVKTRDIVARLGQSGVDAPQDLARTLAKEIDIRYQWTNPESGKDVVLTFRPGTHVSQEDQAKLAGYAQVLSEKNPLSTDLYIDVRVTRREDEDPETPSMSKGFFGMTMPTMIDLNESIFTPEGAAKVRESASLKLEGWDRPYFVSPATEEAAPSYILTHEYGHALGADRDFAGHLDPTWLKNEVSAWPAPSTYAKDTIGEAYAESFADFWFHGLADNEPLVKDLAEHEGWKR